MARQSVPPQLSEVQQTILVSITKRRDSPQQLVRRCRVILLAAEGQSNTDIAPQVGQYQNTVRSWRLRWIAQQEKLNALEADAESNEQALKD